jgi:hypothetical protein
MKHNGKCYRNGILRDGESCRWNDNCTFPVCSYPMPIIKFNGGAGAMLCNECGVIIREGLTKSEFERPYRLFCEGHWSEYQNLTEEPVWVCLDCAKKRGASMPEGHCFTAHTDTCGICQQKKTVTEPRDFGVTRSLLRIYKS